MSDEKENINKWNNWKILFSELSKRTKDPARHPSFVMFCFVAIILIGPSGVWIELYTYLSDKNVTDELLRSSLISFVPAFLAASCMQLIWGEARYLRAFSVLCFAICTLGLLICKLSKSEQFSLSVGFILCAFAIWIWWIANANQKDFMDNENQNFNESTGGDDLRAPLAGKLDGFKTE